MKIPIGVFSFFPPLTLQIFHSSFFHGSGEKITSVLTLLCYVRCFLLLPLSPAPCNIFSLFLVFCGLNDTLKCIFSGIIRWCSLRSWFWWFRSIIDYRKLLVIYYFQIFFSLHSPFLSAPPPILFFSCISVGRFLLELTQAHNSSSAMSVC